MYVLNTQLENGKDDGTFLHIELSLSNSWPDTDAVVAEDSKFLGYRLELRTESCNKGNNR